MQSSKKPDPSHFHNGCFWHRHECHLFKWPKSNEEFWRLKIEGNRACDMRNISCLLQLGLRALVIWECTLKNKRDEDVQLMLCEAGSWIKRGEGSVFEFGQT